MPRPGDNLAASRRPSAGDWEELARLHALWLERQLAHVDRLLERGELDAAKTASTGLYTAALSLPDRHWTAAARAVQGRLDTHRGRHRGAVGTLVEALEHLDRPRRPPAFDRAARALGRCLRRTPTVRAARATTLGDIRRRRYRRGQVEWAQHRRLEGLVFLRRKRFEPAETALRAAARQLLAAGALRDAGLAVLDWGDLCAADNTGHRARNLARETLDALRSADLALPTLLAFEAWVERLGDGDPAAAGERARAFLSRIAT